MLIFVAGESWAGAFSVRTFSPWAGYAIPNGVWLTGDINADGKTDIVHAVQGRDYVHTWISNGTGGFTVGTFRPWAGYAIPNGIWLMADINGDRKADIIHAVQGRDYVHTWISDGTGRFTVGSYRPWAGYAIPNGVWLTGDINGDGKADIIHAVQGRDYVHTWISDGTGRFNVGTYRPWAGYAIPNGVWMAADINGDNKTDIVHAVQGRDYVHTWISDGTGRFNVGTFRPWAGYAIPNGIWMTGDINGDRKVDIVHAVQGRDYVHTWISDGTGRFNVGTFRPWAGYAIPNGVWMMADYDGDGFSDIMHAVQGRDYAHAWLSDGAGRFTVLTFSPWAGYAIPNGIWLTGDFSGDGRSDIVHAVNARDYVHPWLSTLPRANEVALDGFEATQTIQDMAHNVPLVANKSTVARTYLNIKTAAPVVVRGVLQGRRPGGAWSSVNSLNTVTVNPANNWQLRPKRESINQSLNFQIPPAWLAAGNLELRLSSVINSIGGAARPCSDCATSPLALRLQNAAPMRARLIGLRYTTGTPAQAFAPRALDFTLINSWLRRAYPISTLVSSNVTVNATNAWPFGCGQANAQIAAIRANDVNAGTDRRTHYYAVVADGGGFMRGCASTIPNAPDPTAVASGPTGTNNWGWDNDGSYGDWYAAHELGHTYGRLHPGSGCGDSSDDANEPFPNAQLADANGNFVGFDVGDNANGIAMSALPGVTWRDMMSYCQNQWISHYTYGGIRDRITGESVLPAGAMGAEMDLAGAVPSGEKLRPQALAMIGMAPNPRLIGLPAAAVIVTGTTTRPRMTTGHREPPAVVSGNDAAPQADSLTSAGSIPGGAPAPAYEEPPIVQRGFHASTPLMMRAAGPVAEPEVKLQSGDLLSVIATVNITRKTANIQHITRLRTGIAETVVGPQEAEVRFLNSAGNVIKSHAVVLRRDTDIPLSEDQTGLIDAVVPMAAGAAKIQVLLDGEIADARTISKNAPKVRNLKGAPIDLVPRAAGQPVPNVFTWESSDADSDDLTYNVLASTDGGKSWQTIAIGLKEPKLEIERDNFAGVKKILLRVIANDGVNTAVVTGTQPFELK